MKQVKILGTGCPKCEKLLSEVKQVIEKNSLACEVEKITDIMKITEYGVMMTPTLVVDGEVKVFGKVPSPEELLKMLS
ncbi:MAG: thioredoxin family protein [bacterium]